MELQFLLLGIAKAFFAKSCCSALGKFLSKIWFGKNNGLAKKIGKAILVMTKIALYLYQVFQHLPPL